MDTAQTLKTDIEATAQLLGISPSTVGARAGQGGHFYKRLCLGKRVWPETALTVQMRLSELRKGAEEGAA